MTPPDAIGRPRAAMLVLSATLLAGPSSAQTFPGLLPRTASTPTPTPAATPEAVAEATDSPRASARAFVDLTRKGDYDAAARTCSCRRARRAADPGSPTA